MEGKALIQRLKVSDGQALKDIYETYWKAVLTVCQRYTASIDDASELTQDIFCSLWQHRKQLLPDTNLSAYLHQAAKYRSFRFLRDKSRQYKRQETYHIPELDIRASDELQYKELLLKSSKSITALPEPARTIFKLSREQELSYKEIAGQLNISVKMVEYYISKSLKQLRKELHEFL